MIPGKGTLKLPELPDGLEWVIRAEHDRYTVTLSRCPKRDEVINPDVDNEFADTDGGGYVMSHTHRTPIVISQAEWEQEVVNTAHHLLSCYEEGNHHAAWADSLMRRSR